MADRRPNVLIISGDEWRADALGCAGNPIVRTPNIDALAERGMLFTNAYAPAPMCVPSRVSLLTGQVARAHGCISNGVAPTDNTSFVSLLRDAGYRTGAFGKMHFVPVYSDFGFDTMQLAEQHGAGWQIDDYHRWLYEEHGLVDWIDLWDQASDFRKAAPDWFNKSYGALKSPIPEEAHHTTWITDRFIDWINHDVASQDEPWMSWVSYITPHHPFAPPGRYAEMYDPADMPVPDRVDLEASPLLRGFDPARSHFDLTEWSDDDIRRMTALYYGNITMIDDQIGRMMQSLEQAGELENTVVIVTSDHGDYLGHRGFITKAPFVLYEDTICIPFVVAGPSVAAGQTPEAFANLLDIFPTVAAMTGVEHEHRIHGNDLSPVLTGESESVTDIAVSETEGMIAIRQGDWKLIQARDGRFELYDLSDDPLEHMNRGDDPECAEVLAALRDAALRYMLSTDWDRLKMDGAGIQKVADSEAESLGREKLVIDPESWRQSWPDEFTPDV